MSEEDKVFAEEVEPGDNSRRDFLKKSLAVGGALWAAPAIASLPSGAAFGQTGSPVPGCPGCTGTAWAVDAPIISQGPIPAAAGQCGGDPFDVASNCSLSVAIGTVSDPGQVTAGLSCACTDFQDDPCTAHSSIATVNARVDDPTDPLAPLLIAADALGSSTKQDCPSCGITRTTTLTLLTLTKGGEVTNVTSAPPNTVIVLDGITVVANEQGCTASGDPYTMALAVYFGDPPFDGTGYQLAFGYSQAGADGCTCTPQ